MPHEPSRVPAPLDLESEVEPYRRLTPADRARLLVAACRAGAALLRSRSDAEDAAAFEDPLPESSLRALVRLRARAAGLER
jgi:hypothetical protein